MEQIASLFMHANHHRTAERAAAGLASGYSRWAETWLSWAMSGENRYGISMICSSLFIGG